MRLAFSPPSSTPRTGALVDVGVIDLTDPDCRHPREPGEMNPVDNPSDQRETGGE